MFWKKKTSNEITIELASDERRHGVRIKPLDETIIHHGNYQSRLMDISSIGLSFIADKSNLYKKKDGLEVSIMLPGASTEAISPCVCTVKIIYIAKTSYHCQIIQIDRKNQSLLDLFILNEQKRQIQLHSR
ncbi:MAG: PilZ domain-containing protein [gamma proteobacterium symbiont of Lucinoma myriamae]|nr:PilZ domain-containing protein [gamma proteobacterium symbiont of Lucinoma myriamae]MCU7818783.1 PilZ domain-containing protein [gamma proteobacterium symbiont of Lucinoma myriamae]MCU7832663.1 PilZ domain-containing protein [gamma proteobacterium symbiont of Lucinoma myriamae]